MMFKELDIIKGIHPGIFLNNELKKRNISKGRFAISVDEFPQTISAITKGKRGMNTPLALRIEKALNLEEGALMMLQIFYEIKEEKKKLTEKPKPNILVFRPVLFWDTSVELIDWIKYKRAIIQRVLERGNYSEKKELIRFYGKEEIKKVYKVEIGK